MIDYQSEFKQKLIFLLLFILILPLVIIFYFGQKSDIDIKQIHQISIENSKTLNLRGTIRDIKLSRDSKTAYVSADSRGIYIIDVGNPLEPKLISQFKYFKNSYDKSRSIELAEDKNILFVRDAQAGLYSINVENLSEPKLLATYKQQEKIYNFCLSKDENSIYLSDENGIKVLNVKNPDEMKTVTKYDSKKKYFDMVEVKEHLIYLLSSYGVDILDTSFDKEPKLVGNYLASGDAEKITLSLNKTCAILSSGNSGVEILNIANKLNPKPLGIYKSSKMAKSTILSKDGRILYISNFDDAVEIVDIKNPDDAKLLQIININSTKNNKVFNIDLSVDENILFVANGIGGVKVVELRQIN